MVYSKKTAPETYFHEVALLQLFRIGDGKKDIVKIDVEGTVDKGQK